MVTLTSEQKGSRCGNKFCVCNVNSANCIDLCSIVGVQWTNNSFKTGNGEKGCLPHDIACSIYITAIRHNNLVGIMNKREVEWRANVVVITVVFFLQIKQLRYVRQILKSRFCLHTNLSSEC